MTRPDWIHTPDDGRGLRRVFVDGVEVKAVYTDTRRGYCEAYEEPLTVVGGELKTRWLHGKVVVKPDREKPLFLMDVLSGIRRYVDFLLFKDAGSRHDH